MSAVDARGVAYAAYPYPGPPTRPKLFLPTKLKDSMRFFQVPARPWWWGLIALAVYVGCYLVVMFGSSFVLLAADPDALEAAQAGRSIPTTPTLFLINNVAVAMDIGVCTLLAWVFFRQGFGWLVSVIGRFRWKWMGVALGIFAMGYVVEMIVEILIYGAADYGLMDLHMEPYTIFMIVVILVTTPLQCAGEEFQCRAFLPRLITAIVPFRIPGLVLSALVPSTVFMYLHDAQDPWLNLNYFCVALMMWWLAYRTGGIEASIALHFVNNIFSEWMFPFADFSDMFDRSEGTGSPAVLIYIAVQLVLVMIVDWVARKKGVVRMSAPAAVVPVVVKSKKFITRIEGSVVPATKDDLPRIETTIREVPEVGPSYPLAPVMPQAGSPPESPTYNPYIPSRAMTPTPYVVQEEPWTPRHAWDDDHRDEPSSPPQYTWPDAPPTGSTP